jgi:hypothetical protein
VPGQKAEHKLLPIVHHRSKPNPPFQNQHHLLSKLPLREDILPRDVQPRLEVHTQLIPRVTPLEEVAVAIEHVLVQIVEDLMPDLGR